MIRAFDLIFSIILIMILIPIIFPLCIILKHTGEGEVFYSQERIGQNGKAILVHKFATMLKNSPNMGAGTITVANDPRVLPVGRILRKSKINELPQLFNIIKGEMSFIGPRPHALRDLEGVEKEKLYEILNLRPGLSGIGSIVFRDEENIIHDQSDPRSFYDFVLAPYKSDLEIWYARNQNLANYFRLIFLTMIVVMKNNPRLIWATFPTLPQPPSKLEKYIK
jgi:lipopolysaccharide/colanic/teichoic acid biosynthesis glycosyltransferase